jgi:hypothetical protein
MAPNTMAKRPLRRRQFETFLPVEEPMYGFSLIAPSYYRTAVHLLNESERICAKQQSDTCYYVPGAICLFHASLECHLNEDLAQSMMRTANADQPAIVERCRAIQDMTLGPKKLHDFLAAYGFEEKFQPALLDSVIALCDLRDRLYHHSPEARPFNLAPKGVSKILNMAGVPPVNTAWTTMVSHIRVGRWSRSVTEAFVTRHFEILKMPSPFEQKAFGWMGTYDD